jgi:hypothetical protein
MTTILVTLVKYSEISPTNVGSYCQRTSYTNDQLCAKCKTFNFSQQVRWKIRVCATGRKFAEYDQCVQYKITTARGDCTVLRDELLKANFGNCKDKK